MKRAKSTALRPWRQGDLDKMCGLLSAINAIRICLDPIIIGRRASTDLFAAGANYLSDRGFLKGIFLDGISDSQQVQLLSFLCRLVERRYSVRLNIERPFHRQKRHIPIKRFAAALAEFLDHRGRAAICSFETAEYCHLTAIWRVSPSRFYLSDGEHKSLLLRSCSTASSALKRGVYCHIHASSLILLKRIKSDGQRPS